MPPMPPMDTQEPEEGKRAWSPEDEELEEGKWYVRRPNNLSDRIECETFQQTMYWFAGFNIPYTKGDTFVSSVRRVFKYYQDAYEQNNYYQATSLFDYEDKKEWVR
jgi:hypothetical protein